MSRLKEKPPPPKKTDSNEKYYSKRTLRSGQRLGFGARGGSNKNLLSRYCGKKWISQYMGVVRDVYTSEKIKSSPQVSE